MKKVGKNTSNVYAYLDACKVLEGGSEYEIAQARKTYWREYKAAWRRNKRKEEKELTTSWNKQELKILTEEAKKHKTSRTRLIKKCFFAYVDKAYIVPDQIEVRRIAQMLSMNYNSIQDMIDEDVLHLQTGKIILEKILELEREVLVSLHNPKTLEQWVTETIKKNPNIKPHLYHVLGTLSSHDT